MILFFEALHLHSFIRFEGRWKALHTLEHYIQEAAATTVLNSLSTYSIDIMDALHANMHMLEGPPQLPWSHFFDRSRQLGRLSRLQQSCHSRAQTF